MARLIWVQRRDGVVQRYRTTQGRLEKKGYVQTSRLVRGRQTYVWARLGPPIEPIETEIPYEVEAVEEPGPEEVPTGLYEVVFYTEYRQKGRNMTERYEIRTCVEATAENAEVVALQKVFSILPDDYRDFLDNLGLFGIGEKTGISAITRASFYRGLKYYRFFVGQSPGAVKATFGE